MKYNLHKLDEKPTNHNLQPLTLVLVSTPNAFKVPSWTFLAELDVSLHIYKKYN